MLNSRATAAQADPEALHQAVAVIDSVLADLDAGRISADTAAKTIGLKVLTAREVVLEALRAPQNGGAAAMREAIARWHDEVADDRARRLNVRDKHREVYDLLFAERVIHRDCARAVRSVPLPPVLVSQEPGTGGEE